MWNSISHTSGCNSESSFKCNLELGNMQRYSKIFFIPQEASQTTLNTAFNSPHHFKNTVQHERDFNTGKHSSQPLFLWHALLPVCLNWFFHYWPCTLNHSHLRWHAMICYILIRTLYRAILRTQDTEQLILGAATTRLPFAKSPRRLPCWAERCCQTIFQAVTYCPGPSLFIIKIH